MHVQVPLIDSVIPFSCLVLIECNFPLVALHQIRQRSFVLARGATKVGDNYDMIMEGVWGKTSFVPQPDSNTERGQ